MPSALRHKDSRGRLIEDGDIVAYNRSGNVVRGVVLEQRAPRGYTSPLLIVEPIHEGSLGSFVSTGRFVSHTSKIKRPSTVMVLVEGDHER